MCPTRSTIRADSTRSPTHALSSATDRTCGNRQAVSVVAIVRCMSKDLDRSPVRTPNDRNLEFTVKRICKTQRSSIVEDR